MHPEKIVARPLTTLTFPQQMPFRTSAEKKRE
jgi:hypothetical protein